MWKIKCNFILRSHTVMSPHRCQANSDPHLHFVWGWQHLLKSVPNNIWQRSWLFCFFFSLPLPSFPFYSFSITLNFYLHLLPCSTHSHTHTCIAQLRERGLCVLETKAPLSPEWQLSFRLKLTVSEGRGRADNGPRIRYVVKYVCVEIDIFLFTCVWIQYTTCVSLNMGVLLWIH